MPTATATVAKESNSTQIPLKASVQPTHPTNSSTNVTLRTLYNRAARAFVLRDIALTSSLIGAAFALLGPPARLPDSFADHRRKWDVLRITFESTVYTSPPSSTESLSEDLRNMLRESPQALSQTMYSRSLALFTPPTTSNAAYLPSQVLATLVYSSLRLNAPDAGRVMIEDWLSVREPQYLSADGEEAEGDGYGKVLELYCVHILPKLGLWDYAKEFLEYESEMAADRREHLKTALNALHVQAMSTRQPFKPSESSPRSYSPAPSSTSSSSSISTHTVVPGTPRANRSVGTLTKIPTVASSSSASSSFSDETATPRAVQTPLPVIQPKHQPNGNPLPRSGSRSASASASASSTSSYLPARDHQGHLLHELSPSRPHSTASLLALVRSTLAPHLTRAKLTTFLLLFVLVPLVSFVLRVRRRRRLELALGAAAAASASTSAAMAQAATNAERVRRRLQAVGAAESGLVQRIWGEVVRVVGDTVRMGGSGLV